MSLFKFHVLARNYTALRGEMRWVWWNLLQPLHHPTARWREDHEVLRVFSRIRDLVSENGDTMRYPKIITGELWSMGKSMVWDSHIIYFKKPPLTVSNSRSWSLWDVVVLGNIGHIGVDWNVSEQCSKALMWDYSQLSNIINILGIMNQYIDYIG